MSGAVAGIILAPAAQAQGNDWVFYDEVQAAHIPGSQQAAIHNAHVVCDSLDRGVNPALILEGLSSGAGLSRSKAITFFELAATEYCPEHMPKPARSPVAPGFPVPTPKAPEPTTPLERGELIV